MRLVDQAARNNAEWCSTIARLHGVRSTFTNEVWLAASRTPPGYPDVVTLSSTLSDAEAFELIDGGAIDSAAGCSVKDSFATLDLEPLGFTELFDASWIALRADEPEPPPVENGWRWAVVSTAGEFEEWAHGSEVFSARLLQEPGVSILTAHDGENLVGSAILNHTGAVVGVSNVTVADAAADSDAARGDTTRGEVAVADAVWVGIARAARQLHPSLTLVGYEMGADVLAPLAAGFREIGPLRVWVRP